MLTSQVKTLPQLLAERVAQSPDVQAYHSYDDVSGAWQSTSWAQFSARVGQWQSLLQRYSLEPGDRVAICSQNCLDWVACDMACLGLGLVVVPLFFNDRPENVAYILKQSGVRVLAIQGAEQWQPFSAVIPDSLSALSGVVSFLPVTVGDEDLSVDCIDESVVTADQPFQCVDLDPDGLATIVYTSGTTGKPKGVMLSHHNILSNIQSVLTTVEVFPADRLLSFLPLSHMLERTVGYYLPMMAGASVGFSQSITSLPDELLSFRPTLLVSVPRIFERVYQKVMAELSQSSALKQRLFNLAIAAGWQVFLRKQGRANWHPIELLYPLLNKLVGAKIRNGFGGNMRFAVSGGAPLMPECAKLFISSGIDVLQGYGLTETSPIVSNNSALENEPSSIGKPLPGVAIRIDEQSGELLVKGPNVMLGYWDNAEATQQVITSDGWFHTGDIASERDGFFYITGRLKEIIVLANGEKVPPAGMELAIQQDPLFEQVLITGEGRSFLTALVVLTADLWFDIAAQEGFSQELESPEVQQFLLDRISAQLGAFPGYAQVRKLSASLSPWSVENSMLTPTLKLKRPIIEKQYADEISAMYAGH